MICRPQIIYVPLAETKKSMNVLATKSFQEVWLMYLFIEKPFHFIDLQKFTGYFTAVIGNVTVSMIVKIPLKLLCAYIFEVKRIFNKGYYLNFLVLQLLVTHLFISYFDLRLICHQIIHNAMS